MNVGRYAHTSTLLPDGKVLVVGGDIAITDAELFDPGLKTWSPTESMVEGRGYHTATLLPNGQVLVTGGAATKGKPLSSAETYDIKTGTWTFRDRMKSHRFEHTATLLPNNKVLIAGGSSGSSYPTYCELYDVNTGSWSKTAELSQGRKKSYRHYAPKWKSTGHRRD